VEIACHQCPVARRAGVRDSFDYGGQRQYYGREYGQHHEDSPPAEGIGCHTADDWR